jgi:hypothetical protein
VRYAVFLPPFDDFADPRRLVDLAIAAEESCRDGFSCGTMCCAGPVMRGGSAYRDGASGRGPDSRIRIGPHITPVARGWPHRFAPAAVRVVHLSGGRLVLGVGLGVDTDGETSRFGEDLDNRVLAAKLDEALELT